MNIHSEYRFLQGNAGLPENTLKVLGVHSEGFYFLVYSDSQMHYALTGSFGTELSAEPLINYIREKSGFADLHSINSFLMPDAAIAIPDELLNREEHSSLFSSCHVLPESHQLLVSPLRFTAAGLLSSFRKSVVDEMTKVSVNTATNDLAAAWLNKVSENKDEKRMHVFVLPSRFMVAVFVSGKLQLFNVFDYQAKSDFLYFLLGALQSTGLNPSDTTLKLSGEISPSSTLAEALSAYFPDLRYDAAPFVGDADQMLLSTLFFPFI